MYMYSHFLRIVSLFCLLYLLIFMSGDIAKGYKRHSGQMYAGVIDRIVNGQAVILIEPLKETCYVDQSSVMFPLKEQMWVSAQVFFYEDQMLCKNLIYNAYKTKEMVKRMEQLHQKLLHH